MSHSFGHNASVGSGTYFFSIVSVNMSGRKRSLFVGADIPQELPLHTSHSSSLAHRVESKKWRAGASLQSLQRPVAHINPLAAEPRHPRSNLPQLNGDTPRLSGPRPCRSKTADAPMSWSLFCMSRPMGKSSGFVSLSDIST
jgi:hypothetical protein